MDFVIDNDSIALFINHCKIYHNILLLLITYFLGNKNNLLFLSKVMIKIITFCVINIKLIL